MNLALTIQRRYLAKNLQHAALPYFLRLTPYLRRVCQLKSYELAASGHLGMCDTRQRGLQRFFTVIITIQNRKF